jgi:type I restriction enzyme M protein
LERYLWQAAVDLRGQIDAAAYKDYIFPLVFFKRICDVRDEEYEHYVEEGGEEYAEMMIQDSPIQIPEDAHWIKVFNVTENIGQALVDAFRQIENANPGKKIDDRIVGGLEGIFGDKAIWTNKNKMPDATIRNLLNSFNKLTLSLAACPADEMGTGYEYLIGKFADDAGHTAQEFYTNRTVVELMAEILQLQPHESIYDPTCGSGGMLIKSLTYLKDKGEEWRDVKVFGQEINAGTAAIARMNLYLHGIHDFSIVNDDTLLTPAFTKNGKVQQFDVVLANPPYSIKTWNREAFEHDKYGRCFLGVPPQSRADYAFIQHIVASMDEKNGRCAILLPHGVLNRKEEAEMRKRHIVSDNIDAIIGLGRNLFFNSGLESFILICSNRKPKERQGKILFIEAENYSHKEGRQAYLWPEDIAKIVHAYNNLEDEEGFSKWVSIKDITDGNLNIKSYVKSISPKNDSAVEAVFMAYKEQQHRLADAFAGFEFIDFEPLKLDLDFRFSFLDKTRWKKVTLGEVAYEYSSRIENPSESQYEYYIGSDCIGQYDFRINKKSPASLITSAQKEFKAGDYLLVRRSLYGSDFRERAPRADFSGCCSADILTIRENGDYISDGYLIYVLYSKELWDFIVANSSGGLTRRIKWKQIADFELLLPPMDIQKALAEKLWAAYEVKQSYLKMIKATREMVKSQFIEMIKDKQPNGKIGDLVDTNIKSVKKTHDVDDGIEYIDISSIDSVSRSISETTNYVVKSAPSRAQQCVEYGDILVSTVRPINRNIAVVTKESPNLVASTGFCVLRPKEEEYREYLLSVVLTDKYTQKMCDKASGGLYPAINNGDVLSYEVFIPDKEMLTKISTIYHQADKSEYELRSKIDAIDNDIKSFINENMKRIEYRYTLGKNTFIIMDGSICKVNPIFV